MNHRFHRNLNVRPFVSGTLVGVGAEDMASCPDMAGKHVILFLAGATLGVFATFLLVGYASMGRGGLYSH